jgi:acetyl-CoA C-acetyltransferase
MGHAYVIDAVRTPRGRGKAGKGALSGVHPQELFAQTLRALATRTKLGLEDIDDVIAGVVSHAGEQGANLARNAVLAAGFPDSVSATTLNRFCGSGLQAVSFAAMGVASGSQDLVFAGGVESMSRVPMGSDGGGIDGGNLALRKRVFQVPQGISADLIATLEGFTRDELDHFALGSQQKAARAIADKRFARSVVPVLLAQDEYPRADTTLEGLQKLQPAFAAMGASIVDEGRSLDEIARAGYPAAKAIHHVHTAGNSSGIVDGAGAVVIASEAYVKAHGLKPRARIVAAATVGSEPVIMLKGPAPASKKALAKAGLTVADVDLWEINEAFAAVVLETVRTLGIDMEKVNVNGGAIALGHPLGGTGAILLGTIIDELERRNAKIGVVTMCIGGGQGIATVVERL